MESINWGTYSLAISIKREINQRKKNIPFIQVEIYVPGLVPKAEILLFYTTWYKPEEKKLIF